MRKVSDLISVCRTLTQNENFSATSGISDEVFLEFFNDAQDRIQTLISNSNSPAKPFVREDIVSLVANQEGYAIPRRLAYGKEVENVEFSFDSSLQNYYPLEKRAFINRNTTSSNYPAWYYRRAQQIYLNPIPSVSQGSLRILYEYSLDDLDKRRGLISTVTGLTSTTFTSITIDSTADESSSPINLTNADYICVVDKDGVVKAYNIPFGNYNTGTNVWTPAAGFTFNFTGESIAINQYVVFGKFKTTHSSLPDDLENYLLQYSVMRVYHIDSSVKFKEQSAIVTQMEAHITEQARSQTGELQRWPQLDFGEWW